MNDTSRPDPTEIGWGHLPEDASANVPGGSSAAPPPTSSGWTTVRVVLFWLMVGLGTFGFVGGVGVVLEDMSDTTDSWHGFGIFIGSIVAVPALCVAVLAGAGLWAHRRKGAGASRVYAHLLGGLLLLTVLLVPATPAALVPATLGALLVASAYADRKPQPPATR